MPGVSKGAAGEILAARFLREKGYDIWSANFKSRFGEIDIIAVKKPYIAFVEVKSRLEDSLFAPREAVTFEKQRKIIKCAALYLKNKCVNLQPRFDVIEVITKSNRPLETATISHIKGAFEAGELNAAF